MRARFNLRCVVDGQISGDSPPEHSPACRLSLSYVSTPGCRHNSRARPSKEEGQARRSLLEPTEGREPAANKQLPFPCGHGAGEEGKGLGSNATSAQ